MDDKLKLTPEQIKSLSEQVQREREEARTKKRWNDYLNRKFDDIAYYVSIHESLLQRAKSHPPERIGNRVSDFTDWIYSLYIPDKKEADLRRGKDLERAVLAEKGKIVGDLPYDKSWIPIPGNPQWRLIFNGMCDSSDYAYRISALTIHGRPIFGKPDLVFQERSTKRILIIEIKISEAAIPDGGWPNLRAQLWAYSKIDVWADTPDMLLIGEVWGFERGLRLRRSQRWQPQALEAQNGELFDLYKSRCRS
jgi:hypothetical protein